MQKIKTKTLDQLGFKNDQTKSLLINLLKKEAKHWDINTILQTLTLLIKEPTAYVTDPIFAKVAQTLIAEDHTPSFTTYSIQTALPYAIFGKKHIDALAIKQMDMAMSLPIVDQGALMPDAHGGYGLPIGGVLATKQAVIPYAVGVDIGCRMALSIVDASDTFFKSHHYQMTEALRNKTHFGMEGGLDFKTHHDILDDNRFQELSLLRKLKGKAARQLGTSGSGNHFVEFGLVNLEEGNAMHLPSGHYVGLLSHSGSRGLGSHIAQHYANVAQAQCKLPPTPQQLAWLDMNSEAGQEYWMAMNLAGDYAKACHDVIHQNLLMDLGLKVLYHIDNHHNFAWEETLANGEPLIVHRKGATPASLNKLGIIPCNMVDPAYIVMGKGNEESLQSASHGAGRQWSRSKAKQKTTVSELKKLLKQHDITLIGGSVEESPMAYKAIDEVMMAQQNLVSIEGKFYPKIVRMYKS
jgi:tRNA-splicing ligase RtcB